MLLNIYSVGKGLVEMVFSGFKIIFLLTLAILFFFLLKHYVFSASFIYLCGTLAWLWEMLNTGQSESLETVEH